MRENEKRRHLSGSTSCNSGGISAPVTKFKAVQVAIAVVLAVALACAMGLSTGVRAFAIDLSRTCALTVNDGPAASEAGANTVVDLYKVASASPVSGIDTYQYEVTSDFGDLSPDLSEQDKLTNVAYRIIAQKAMNILFPDGVSSSGSAQPNVTPTVANVSLGKQITGLEPGLYLALAHGAGMTPSEYVVPISTDFQEQYAGDTGETAFGVSQPLGTISQTETQVFTYAPELISLPTKEAVVGGLASTANPGEWIYDATVTLKPQMSERTGSLEIVKMLQSYDTSEPVRFVFQIEASKDGAAVYSNVKSVAFDAAGTQSVVVDGIPVGSVATVTEVYSGASYELSVGEASQSATIAAEEVVQVSFTNAYTPTNTHGGGVINSFEYDGSAWQWSNDQGDGSVTQES